MHLLGWPRQNGRMGERMYVNQCSVFRYLQDYHHHNKTTPGSRGGRQSHLTEKQEQEIKDHLNQTIFRSTVEIASYVLDTFGVNYN